jgi:hypothetical protein
MVASINYTPCVKEFAYGMTWLVSKQGQKWVNYSKSFVRETDFFYMIFFCLPIENNDVNVLDKFVLIVSVFNDEDN